MKTSAALVIPAVGPKLAPALFEGTSLKLVQVTGAGVDRLDQAALTKLGIPVAAILDSNSSPDGIGFPIPGNDDALKSIRLFTAAIADAATEGLHVGRNEAAGQGGGVEVFRRSASYVDEAAMEGREDES